MRKAALVLVWLALLGGVATAAWWLEEPPQPPMHIESVTVTEDE